MTGTPQLFEGNGLGLAICARLIHLMGGEMSVESEEWQGSSFAFGLPVAVAAVASAAGRGTAAGASRDARCCWPTAITRRATCSPGGSRRGAPP